MKSESVLQQLQRAGYARVEEYTEPVQFKSIVREDFSEKILNHIVLEHITLDNCTFDKACVTGSIFRHCQFNRCTFDQANFEFCEFSDCTFQGEVISGCSYNQSTFMETEFHQIHFNTCTFTGTFFRACFLNAIKITMSTLEGALFRDCAFSDVDFRFLNMDFIELDHPHMERAVLPISQIPFMFGALQYLRHTDDSVRVSKGDLGVMEPSEFFGEIVPLYLSYFSASSQYFPLANICYALERDRPGLEAVESGLRAAAALRDFRMVKYFCKLIAYAGALPSESLHSLYNNYICRLFPQSDTSNEIPNYSRYILEIKSLLFAISGKASFRVTLKTDISLSENWKLGALFKSIFSLAKFGALQESDIKTELQQNSPLLVTIQVSGEESRLLELLTAYLQLAGVDENELERLPVISQGRRLLSARTGDGHRLAFFAQAQRRELLSVPVHLIMMEYYVENFRQYCGNGEPYYYFNGSAVAAAGLLKD